MTTVDGAKGPGGVSNTGGAEPSAVTNWDMPPTIPNPYSGFSDPVAAALAAVAQFSRASRSLSNELKKTQQAMREAADRERIAAMRDKASEIQKGALISGICLGVSAGFSAAAFASSLSSPAPTDAAAKEGVGCAGSPATREAIDAQSRENASKLAIEGQRATHASFTNMFEAGAKSALTGADISGRTADGRAAICDADAFAAESRAKSAETEAEIYGDHAKQADEIAAKAADAIRAVAEARHAAQMAIASIRG